MINPRYKIVSLHCSYFYSTPMYYNVQSPFIVRLILMFDRPLSSPACGIMYGLRAADKNISYREHSAKPLWVEHDATQFVRKSRLYRYELRVPFRQHEYGMSFGRAPGSFSNWIRENVRSGTLSASAVVTDATDATDPRLEFDLGRELSVEPRVNIRAIVNIFFSK